MEQRNKEKKERNKSIKILAARWILKQKKQKESDHSIIKHATRVTRKGAGSHF